MREESSLKRVVYSPVLAVQPVHYPREARVVPYVKDEWFFVDKEGRIRRKSDEKKSDKEAIFEALVAGAESQRRRGTVALHIMPDTSSAGAVITPLDADMLQAGARRLFACPRASLRCGGSTSFSHSSLLRVSSTTIRCGSK